MSLNASARLAAALAGAALLIAGSHHQARATRVVQADFRLDEDAERELVRLTNDERAQAGVAKLETDERITQAAREHARRMAERNDLSHQFPGELPLMQRLAQSDLRFNAAAENISKSESAAETHSGLMNSPPHRRNILNPRYNAVGVGAVRRGSLIYVAQNFVHQLPQRTAAQAEAVIAREFAQARRRLDLRRVSHDSSPALRAAACEMARSDRPSAQAAPAAESSHQRTVVAYTASAPEELPDTMAELARKGDLRRYSLGACFARSPSYPSGTFWVLVIFEF